MIISKPASRKICDPRTGIIDHEWEMRLGALMDNAGVFPSYTAANILDKTHAVNTLGKVAGRTVLDTTNGRLMVAQGSSDTSAWKSADGGTTVTPA